MGRGQLGDALNARPRGPRQPGPVLLEHQGPVTAVAGEDIVAARPGEQHLDAVFAGQSADEQGVDRCRIRLGFIQVIDHVFQVIHHLAAHLDQVQIHIQVFGYFFGVGQVVGHALRGHVLTAQIDAEAL